MVLRSYLTEKRYHCTFVLFVINILFFSITDVRPRSTGTSYPTVVLLFHSTMNTGPHCYVLHTVLSTGHQRDCYMKLFLWMITVPKVSVHTFVWITLWWFLYPVYKVLSFRLSICRVSTWMNRYWWNFAHLHTADRHY